MKSEWKRYTIEDIASISAGGDKPKVCSNVRTAETPFPVFSNGLESCGLYGYTNKAKIEGDTITISARGVNVGTVCYRKEPFLPIVRLLSLIPDRKIVNARYLYYLLRNTPLSGTGSAQPQITVPMIKKQEICIHNDIETQKSIAGILSCLDDKIALNTAINENLQEQAQAIFKNLIANVQKQVPFTSVIQVLGGGTPKTSKQEYWNGEIPFFTPKDVGTPYALTTEKNITPLGLDNCNSRLYPIDTVFLTARGTVGKVSLAGVPMAMNQSCYALLGKNELHSIVVYHYVLETVNALKHKASGAVFDAIITRDFDAEYIPELSSEQINNFVFLAEPMYADILNRTIENQHLAVLRDTLLPKLMSGEIDVSTLDL